jgi:hypothetical protein
MLNYIALVLLIFVALFLFYAIIAIHDIPYEIARKRKHPHQDAIHVAGWVSLLTLHVIWPFLWIWATLYREDRGWGMAQTGTLADDLKATAASDSEEPEGNELGAQLALLTNRIAELEARLERESPRSATD